MGAKTAEPLPRRLYPHARRAAAKARYVAASRWGHEDYVRFLIVTRSRTGSNMLVEMLNNHPNATVGLELVSQLDGLSPASAIEKQFRRHPRWVHAVGFKVFYYHPLDGPTAPLWDYVEASRGIRIVHLRRRNILRTLTSRRIAARSGEWTARTGVRLDVPEPVRFMVSELESGFRETRAWEGACRRRLSDHPLVEVLYEDLIESPAQHLERVVDFLDLPPVGASSTLQRQNPQPLPDLIENYSELRSAFEGSEWGGFFRE